MRVPTRAPEERPRPEGEKPSPPSWVVALLVAALALMAGAISFAVTSHGGDDDQPGVVLPPLSSPPTTDARAELEATVLEAYKAAYFTVERLVANPNVEAAIPELRKHFIGEGPCSGEHADDPGKALCEVVTTIMELQADGVVIRGGERDELLRHQFLILEEARAVLQTCWRGYGEHYDANTGRLLTDGKPGLGGGEDTLVFEQGIWKVADLKEAEEACAGVEP